MRAPLLVALLLAGCAGAPAPEGEPASDRAGAFPPRPTLDDAPARAEGERGCLAIAAETDRASLAPGDALTVLVRLENCGDAPLALEPDCGSDVAARLLRGENGWRLDGKGTARATCAADAAGAGTLAPRATSTRTFVWRGYVEADPCSAGRWSRGAVPAATGTYTLVLEAATSEGLRVAERLEVEVVAPSGSARVASTHGPGVQRLMVGPLSPHVEKPYMLLTRQTEWEDLCRGRVEGGSALGPPHVDLERESVLVVHGACVVAVGRAGTVTQVFTTACRDQYDAVAIAAPAGEVRLVDVDARFVPPHEPPTADPAEPYAFDPALAVHLTRDADGVLAPVGGGHGYVEGEWQAMPPPPQEPLPPCDPQAAPAPGPSVDVDGDKVWDDLQGYVSALAPEERASVLVAMRCPFAWNDVLALREAVGHFPVNAVWSTGAQAVAADLTPAQVRALASLPEVRGLEGNARVSIG